MVGMISISFPLYGTAPQCKVNIPFFNCFEALVLEHSVGLVDNAVGETGTRVINRHLAVLAVGLNTELVIVRGRSGKQSGGCNSSSIYHFE